MAQARIHRHLPLKTFVHRENCTPDNNPPGQGQYYLFTPDCPAIKFFLAENKGNFDSLLPGDTNSCNVGASGLGKSTFVNLLQKEGATTAVPHNETYPALDQLRAHETRIVSILLSIMITV